MIKRLFFLLFLVLFLGLKMSPAQNEMFKALFLYNFTKDIDWPENFKQGNFKVGVLGNSAIIGELKKIAKKKTVGSQPIEVIKFNSVDEIQTCHVLYITPDNSEQLANVVSKISGNPTLLITDKPGLANQGAGINYISVDGSQKFEINRKNIENTGLKINSFLLSLGIVVE